MYTKTEHRLLGLALAALAVTMGGDLLGSQLLMTVGVAGFAVALLTLFAVMSVVLVVGVGSDLNAPDLRAVDRAR